MLLVCLLIITPQAVDNKASSDRNETTTERYHVQLMDAINKNLTYVFCLENIYLLFSNHQSCCDITRCLQNGKTFINSDNISSTWYPETEISDCCSIEYDSNVTAYKEILKDQYDFTDGNAIKALVNIVLDVVQGRV